MSAPKCLFFFQDFDRPDRSFGPGHPRESPNDPRMSAGCPSQELPLRADFSFLIFGVGPEFWCFSFGDRSSDPQTKPDIVTARVSHKTRNPRKNKVAQK